MEMSPEMMDMIRKINEDVVGNLAKNVEVEAFECDIDNTQSKAILEQAKKLLIGEKVNPMKEKISRFGEPEEKTAGAAPGATGYTSQASTGYSQPGASSPYGRPSYGGGSTSTQYGSGYGAYGSTKPIEEPVRLTNDEKRLLNIVDHAEGVDRAITAYMKKSRGIYEDWDIVSALNNEKNLRLGNETERDFARKSAMKEVKKDLWALQFWKMASTIVGGIGPVDSPARRGVRRK